MLLKREVQPPRAPFIRAFELPSEEQEAGRSLEMSLQSLETYARELLAAVALFDFCDSQPETMLSSTDNAIFHWRFLAARGGAIAIYNYAKAMAGVRSVLGLCPTWHAKVDGKALREVEKDFEKLFPFYYELRQAIAHEAELWESPKKVKINRPEKGPLMSNNLFNRSYATTYEGQLVQYEVTGETVLALNEVTRRFFEPFKPVVTF